MHYILGYDLLLNVVGGRVVHNVWSDDTVDPDSDEGVCFEMYLLADLHTLHLRGLEALSSNWSWLVMRNFSSLDALFQLALKLALDNIMRGTYSSICTGLTTFL
jgi:hypothetical protein